MWYEIAWANILSYNLNAFIRFALKYLKLNVTNKHQNWSRPWMSAMTVLNYWAIFGASEKCVVDIFKNKHRTNFMWCLNRELHYSQHHSRNGIRLQLEKNEKWEHNQSVGLVSEHSISFSFYYNKWINISFITLGSCPYNVGVCACKEN